MKRLTTLDVRAMKERGEPIAMITAYDATFAGLLEEAGTEMLLVGDSLGMVVQGHESTLPVTMDQMVYHTAAVVRGTTHAFIVADMPFMSYQASVPEALRNAGRLLAEGGAQAVKLEGGVRSAPAVRAMVDAGIPVVGHIGLTPQSVNALGGFKVQGRDEAGGETLFEDALVLEESGAFALVLETVPGELAARITEALSIPTIGIGAGSATDGQVLVCYDLLGLNEHFTPKFLKRYANLGAEIRGAAAAYVREVKERSFPELKHTFR